MTGTEDSPGAEASKADCTEKFIAPAFKHNPTEAALRLSDGFFSAFSIHENLEVKKLELENFLKEKYGLKPTSEPVHSKAVIWIRNVAKQNRNMTTKLIEQVIAKLSKAAEINEFIFVGDKDVALPAPGKKQKFYKLIDFFNQDGFKAISGGGRKVDSDFTFATQLLMFEVLRQTFALKVIVGMRSGAMDGPAMVGIPTIFFDEDTGAGLPTRMSCLAAAIPGMTRVTFSSKDYDSVTKPEMPPDTITALGAAVKKLKLG